MEEEYQDLLHERQSLLTLLKQTRYGYDTKGISCVACLIPLTIIDVKSSEDRLVFQ